MKPSEFEKLFKQLTDFKPFPWQSRLFSEFVEGRFESCSTCCLPTGLGKTSLLPIWLVALAINPTKVPRRLVYVVNRRTVVDQTTIEAQSIRDRLPNIPDLENALRLLCSIEETIKNEAFCPLSISTLRGQFADNRDWSTDPCRPAIISGTVDMIGSRLLFDGYRCGFKSKPMHAGFLATDVLLIHDEAHLEPAFQSLLQSIVREQMDGRFPEMDRGRALRVIELSATTRGDGPSDNAFTLDEEDRQNPEIAKRVSAPKQIKLHRVEKEGDLAAKISELAKAHASSGQAILVFVRKVSDVHKIVDELRKGRARNQPNNIAQLTGTIRGHERDQLATGNPVFQRFLSEKSRSRETPPLDGTVYLVATSAGEVGVNISADHAVFDLTTFESLAQRLGRVNRFGTGNAQVDLVAANSIVQTDEVSLRPMEIRLKRTWELVKQLPEIDGVFDGSSTALHQLPPKARTEAFSPPPQILHVDEMLFDTWAMTTLSMPLTKDSVPGRAPIEDWLHGVTEYDTPQTQVAWRKEVSFLAEKVLDNQPRPLTRERILEAYPLKPHELLSDRTDRVFDGLKSIVEKFCKRKGTDPAKTKMDVWVVGRKGKITVANLCQLADPNAKATARKRLEESLRYQTVVLPETFGGLDENGMLVGEWHEDVKHDVADEQRDATGRLRLRYRSDEELSEVDAVDLNRMRTALKVNLSSENGEGDGKVVSMVWSVRKRELDDESLSFSSSKQQFLQAHLDSAENYAECFTAALGLSEPIANAVRVAAKYHDLGKRRKLWQRGIGNSEYNPADVATAWAKSGTYSPPVNRHYRHEFGSLADIIVHDDFLALESEMKELTLHLIAAHHGRARPHFPIDESFDPEATDVDSTAIATLTPLRFSRLQRRYGRWQLAWLESLVRAADYLASQQIAEGVHVEEKASV